MERVLRLYSEARFPLLTAPVVVQLLTQVQLTCSHVSVQAEFSRSIVIERTKQSSFVDIKSSSIDLAAVHRGFDMSVVFGLADDYGHVEASVNSGEINAAAFDVNKGGLFRSFDHNGPGKYRLYAHVGAGELDLR